MITGACAFLLVVAWMARERTSGPIRRLRKQWLRERYDINPALRGRR